VVDVTTEGAVEHIEQLDDDWGEAQTDLAPVAPHLVLRRSGS